MMAKALREFSNSGQKSVKLIKIIVFEKNLVPKFEAGILPDGVASGGKYDICIVCWSCLFQYYYLYTTNQIMLFYIYISIWFYVQAKNYI